MSVNLLAQIKVSKQKISMKNLYRTLKQYSGEEFKGNLELKI